MQCIIRYMTDHQKKAQPQKHSLPVSSMQIPNIRRMLGDSNFFMVVTSLLKTRLTVLWGWKGQLRFQDGRVPLRTFSVGTICAHVGDCQHPGVRWAWPLMAVFSSRISMHDTCYNIDLPWKDHAKWKESNTKGHISYHSMCAISRTHTSIETESRLIGV